MMHWKPLVSHHNLRQICRPAFSKIFFFFSHDDDSLLHNFINISDFGDL